MKKVEVWRESESDKRASDIIHNIGYSKAESRVIIYLISLKEGTSTEIERSMDLRQPEVSLAMTSLTRKKIIKHRASYKERKGRPELIYSLITPSGTLSSIEATASQKIIKTHSLLVELRTLVSAM